MTIIGGSSLFHGAPILAAKTASRIVDMVFFASPEPGLAEVVAKMKAQLSSFIWVPWSEVEEYIEKSDSVLIGPGLMRYRSEKRREADQIGEKSKKITESLLAKFPQKQWLVDAGSLQVMEAKFIPKGAILTPNPKEFQMLFRGKSPDLNDIYHYSKEELAGILKKLAAKHECFIVLKTKETLVASPDEAVVVKGGNLGMTKGGVGDVLAGTIVALVAKNPPFLAACAGSFVVKKAAEELHKKVGFAYNADDLAEEVPEVLGKYWR